jgi:hypothetical protein
MLHVHSVCPRCMSVFYVYSTLHVCVVCLQYAACLCCMSTVRCMSVLYVYSTLHVRVVCLQYAACPCCITMLVLHAACPCYMFMMHIYYILHVHAANSKAFGVKKRCIRPI